MKSKRLIDSIGMVDPSLVDRAATRHTARGRIRIAWISAVAAVLAIAIIAGAWGGMKLIGNWSFFGGNETTPIINPFGSDSGPAPDATPEITPEVTPEVIPAPESTPDSDVMSPEEIIEIVKEAYLADSDHRRQIYNVYYYGEVERGYVAFVVHSEETKISGTFNKIGKYTFSNYGVYVDVYFLFYNGTQAHNLDMAYTYLSDEENEAVYKYWRSNIDEFSREAQAAEQTAPESTIEGTPVETPPEAPEELAEQMKAIRNSFRSDTNNQYKICYTWYYGEIEYGYVAFLLHEYRYRYNGSDFTLQGYEFNENTTYFDIYILPYGSETAVGLSNSKVTDREAEELYNYWMLNKGWFEDILIEAGYLEAPPETTPEVTTELSPAVTLSPLPDDLNELIPPDVELGAEMNVFAGVMYYDEWLEADDGDIIGKELYNRVARVEQGLGISLNVITAAGMKDTDLFMEEVRKRQESSDPNERVDAISGYTRYIGSLTLEGRFKNIAAAEEIDLDNPWWPKDLANSGIDGKIYFVSGDISPTILYETYAIFYNDDFVRDLGVEDPMKLVNSGKWTLDKLVEVTAGLFGDRDGSKNLTKGDRVAFNFNDVAHYKAIAFGAGIRVIVSDASNGYALSSNISGSSSMGNVYNTVKKWLEGNEGVNSPTTGFSDYNTGFMSGDVVFNLGTIGSAVFYYADSDISYSFVPCPMRSEKQGEYFSGYGFPSSLWAIPTNTFSFDNSAALIEYLAADAFVHISPAIFAKATGTAYVPNDESGQSKMFDLIRSGIVFDPSIPYANFTRFGNFTELTGSSASWSVVYSNSDLKIISRYITNSIVQNLRYNAE